MAQIMLDLNNNYQVQIHHLRTHGDVLLQRIKMFEIKMNRIKQRNQQPNQQDINSLNAMVKKLLRMLAEINTYKYFQITSEPFSCVNQNYFNQICNNKFNDLIRNFIMQLRLKRLRRLQILKHTQNLQRINNFQQPVDFQIWQ